MSSSLAQSHVLGKENGVETLKQDESKEEGIGNMQFWTEWGNNFSSHAIFLEKDFPNSFHSHLAY